MGDYQTRVSVGADGIVDAYAYGGTRRQRSAQITAALRALRASGVQLERFHVNHSEGHDFLARTWSRYRVVAKK